MESGRRVRAALTREPIDLAELVREVECEAVGAIATFLGVVRAETNDAGRALLELEYSGHEAMAVGEMQRIAGESFARLSLHAAVVLHRLGRLNIGETSIAIAVSAPHRAAAFEACREIIERVKVDVPIFKRELWRDGGPTWVTGI